MRVRGKFYGIIMSLEISHLVTVGCSFTYCQGLEDPTTQGWPGLLSQRLNIPVVNLGVPASGNDSMYRILAEYFYLDRKNNSKPFFIIAFSQALRREEYLTRYKGHPINNMQTLTSYGDEPIERSIYEHLDDTGIYFMEERKLLNWLSIINLLKANNIPYFTTNYMADHEESIVLLKRNHPEMYSAVYDDENKISNFHELTYKTDLTKCKHDGPKAQKKVSDYCYETLLKKYTEIVPVKMNYTTLKDYVDVSYKSDASCVWTNNEWYLKELNNVLSQ